MQVDQSAQHQDPVQQEEPAAADQVLVPQEQLQQMQISTQPESNGRDGANIIMNEEEAKYEDHGNSNP